MQPYPNQYPNQPPPPPPKSGASTVVIVLVVLFFGGICMLGVLAAIAIPAFTRYVKRSKTSEATMNISAIYAAEVSYFNRSMELPGATVAQFVSCTPSHAQVPAAVRVAGDWTTPGWVALGFSAPTPTYYQYTVIATGSGRNATVTIRATGDLDGDGTPSTFERTAHVEGDEVVGSPIAIVNELE